MLATYLENKIKNLYEGCVKESGPERGPKEFAAGLTESFKNGTLRLSDFSIKRLATVCLSESWHRNDPRVTSGFHVLEAGSSDAVDVTAFSNITGQIVYNRLLEFYEAPMFIGSRLVPSTPTTLDGEKIAGIGKIGDDGEVVREGMPIPSVGLQEDFIQTPSTDKKALIIPVTKEAIFFDRTAQIMKVAGSVGEALAWRKEKDILRVILGITNNFNWLGAAYNTYQETPGAGWTGVRDADGSVNAITGATNELQDWTDLETADLLFGDLKDPNTGEPIVIVPQSLLVPNFKKFTARNILNATEIRETVGTTETLSSNPLAGAGLAPESSPLVKQLLVAEGGLTAGQADKTWFLGDFAKAFGYMENWPLTVVQAPSNSEAEFSQDITLRFKASERGVAVVEDPRFAVRVKGF